MSGISNERQTTLQIIATKMVSAKSVLSLGQLETIKGNTENIENIITFLDFTLYTINENGTTYYVQL